ncbi:MAG: LysM peptidoglycan-binding domain-containing protein [Bacteroidota bacterium]|nr:LysM peptidoglycan-binding domain-containing protein [Bacteroidota bacterium]
MVPIFYNEQVRISINQLLKNTNNSTSILLGKAEYYYQKYSKIFEENEIPKQLFFITAANSQCNSDFVDSDGASGMWAISYAIAKKYNLNTNSYIDERRNINNSTKAATEYLIDLNDIYKDWLKTLVAFRIGPINMNMAIHKSDKSLNYSKLHNNLINEHQMVAVNYMAFWYLWNYRAEHKIQSIKFRLPDSDTVHVKQEISLNSIAFQMNMPIETLKILNPELRLNIMPVFYNSNGLKLPIDKIQFYRDNLNNLFPSFYNQNNDSLITDSLELGKDPKKITSQRIEDNQRSQESNSRTNTIYYKVKKGDGLLLLADIFDCKVADIKKWNGIKKDQIFAGQKLKIIIPESKLAYYKKINSMTMVQKRTLAKKR